MRRHRHWGPDWLGERGQSLVEFALVLPVLLLLLLVAIDFGRVYLGYVNLQNITRIAANYAANNPTTNWTNSSDPIVATYNRLIANDSSATNCTVQADASGHNPPRPTFPSGTALGSPAQVQLTCKFGLITPIIRDIFGGNGTIPVSAEAIFPVKSGGIAGIGVVGGGGPQIPQAAFTGNPTSGAASLTVNFTDQSTNAPTSWNWNFEDPSSAQNTSTSQNPSHVYATAGSFTVSLQVVNADGNTTLVKTNYIVVNAASVANFTATPLSGAQPLTVAFTDTSTGGPTSWSWNFGDPSSAQNTSTLQTPSHTYSTAGSYAVTLTVNGPGGSATKTQASYITVNAAQCTVPNVSDGFTHVDAATTTLRGLGFVVATVGSGSNWTVRVQSPQGGLEVACGSTVTLYK